MDNDHVSILLDIKTEIGALNANMTEAMHSRRRLEQGVEEMKSTIAEIKPVVVAVAEMRPEVDDLMRFKQRIGSYIWLGGSIAAGAVYILWQGVQFFSENLKSGVGKIFH